MQSTLLSLLAIADYAKNEVNFVLSVLSLEELGARGNLGLAGLVDNPVHSLAIGGLATSATGQATIEVRGLSGCSTDARCSTEVAWLAAAWNIVIDTCCP